MNTQEKVSRLEELLARIKTRSAEPRTTALAAGAPILIEHAPDAVATASPPSALPVMAEAAQPVFPSEPPMASAHPVAATDPITTPPEPGEEFDSDAEVSSEVVELDLDEAAYVSASEASAELIEVEDDEDAEPMTTQTSSYYPEALKTPPPRAPVPVPANEIEEPAPSSSRRPIASEEPESAFDAESAPRHTPPPESGKQVASASPPARRSLPPASLEGQTLIGGWREPGMAGSGPPGPSVTPYAGVRLPTAEAPPTRASGTRLSPDVSKPSLPLAAHVASIEGVPPAFKPSSFGDLLDATLAL